MNGVSGCAEPILRALALAVAALLLAACAGDKPKPTRTANTPAHHGKKPWQPLGPYTPGGLYAPGVADGAPAVPPDVANLPEPVPHPEPLARYGNRSPYVVLGKTYTVLPSAAGYDETGVASWYGTKFDGRVTSSLEPYDLSQFSAAHRTLPLPSYARVTNLENGRSVIVRINDRGPFHDGRLIDLSYAAAIKLGVNVHGTAKVEVKGIDTGKALPTGTPNPDAQARPAAPRPAPVHTVSPEVSAPAPRVATPASDPIAAFAAKPVPDAVSASPRPQPSARDASRDAAPTASSASTSTSNPDTDAAQSATPASAQPTPFAPVPAVSAAAATIQPQSASQQTTPPTTAPQVGRPAIDPSTVGFLQVASYGDRDNAEHMRERLQRAGIGPVELVAVQVADRQMWRVHVGPLRADAADALSERMQALGFGEPPFFKQ
ncbi:MAG: septal ring lytic transglycosylase RlpA family protein [Proteobacteria bacterium]|nr:septal ring lytic transglycosylase RlpA family protein [Pseudomonadota bacterium]